jgi:hypothetical protein
MADCLDAFKRRQLDCEIEPLNLLFSITLDDEVRLYLSFSRGGEGQERYFSRERAAKVRVVLVVGWEGIPNRLG